ncbi:MAG: tetraacyldisaccharide 4'-kinase [Halanaerobiales bacterium]
MLNKLKDYLIQVIKGNKKGIVAKITLIFLSFLEYIYLIIIQIRNIFYRYRIIKSKKIDAFVISIGNITGGGTGKTPLVEKIVEELKNIENNVAVITRGYRGENDISRVVKKNTDRAIKTYGDEAIMLASHLTDTPVIIGKKRYKSGQKALQLFDSRILILDDGFQHRQLKRDLDIVIIDALNPSGYNHLIPRGYLREPLSALKRADIFIISKSDLIRKEKLKQIREKLKKYNKDIPLLEMNYQPLNYHLLNSISEEKIEISLASLKTEEIIAVSGIGNPDSFLDTLKKLEVKIKSFLKYGDHHPYCLQDIKDIIYKCKQHKVKKIIITEKDAVKLNKTMLKQFRENEIKIYSLNITVKIKPEEKLINILKRKYYKYKG